MNKKTVLRIVLPSLAALAVLAVTLSWVAAVAGRPAIACQRCHNRPAFTKATAAAPHSDVSCVACHGAGDVGAKTTFASNQVFGMYVRVVNLDPSTAKVGDAACLKCHKSQMKQVVSAQGLRIVHSTCMAGRACTDCHSATAHGNAESWPKSATMDMCFECHSADSGVASAKCDTCHDARLPADRIRTGVFAVTHGPNHMKTHGLAPMRTCGPCHDSSKCSKCHGPGLPHDATFVNTHGAVAKNKAAKCFGCHKKSFCTDCHVYAMPHPKDFVLGHAKVVKAKTDGACRRCHDKQDCNECHVAHIHPTTAQQQKDMGFGIGKKGSK